MLRILCFIVFILFFRVSITFGTDTTGDLCGLVFEQKTRTELPGAVVHLTDLNRFFTTDAEGRFCIVLPAGTYKLEVTHVGLQKVEREVEILPGERTELLIAMAYSALNLDEISVTARPINRLDQPGTVNRIEREAIEHIQASSLADLFELLPGQLSGTPGLSSPRQTLLRQVPTTAEAARSNALGTGIFVDGVPISNNANLQEDVTILNAAPGSLPPFSSVAGRGSDLREISPDLIESLEVVQGIPSARFGDITSGAVLVQSRAGAITPQIRFRFNPNVLDANFTAGFGDGLQNTGISFSGTITQSQDDPRQNLDRYNRLTGQLNLSRSWLSNRALRTNFRLQASQFLDERRRDPQDEVAQRERESQDRFFQFSTNTSYAFRPDRSHRITLDASVSLRQQRSFYSENITRIGLFPLSDALIDTTMQGTFGSTQYRNVTTVEGNPLNIYGRLEYTNRFLLGSTIHMPVAGLEWKHDSNRGDGRQFDVLRPPRQNYSVGDRPRRFDDIPGLNLVSAYAEHRMAGQIGYRTYSIQAGLRFDNVSPETPFMGEFGTVLAPRLNASAEILPKIHLRGGYGLTAKAPTLNVLYPGPRYFDVVNFSYFTTDPAERLAILTTAVVEPDNSGIRPYTTTKTELGTYFDSGSVYAAITFFQENTEGAYGFSREVFPVTFDRFEAISFPEGAPPELNPDPIETRVFLGAYDRPVNNRFIRSRGYELDSYLDLRLPWLSSLALSGAWIRSTSGDDGLTIDTNRLFGSAVPNRIGIYSRENNERDRLSTSIRSIHHIPSLGLVVSLLGQTVWMDRDRRTNVETNPVGFITADGEQVIIPEDQRGDESFADVRRQVSEAFLLEERRPPLWLFNMRISKSFTGGIQASFFANNVFSSRPLYESTRSGSLIRRNPPLFFGFDLSVQIRSGRSLP
ncbi:MAG: TonB-dependent receptor [Balneolia bacterium]|nr:TonB-dependent receptor [Balneolia bacterium]